MQYVPTYQKRLYWYDISKVLITNKSNIETLMYANKIEEKDLRNHERINASVKSDRVSQKKIRGEYESRCKKRGYVYYG